MQVDLTENERERILAIAMREIKEWQDKINDPDPMRRPVGHWVDNIRFWSDLGYKVGSPGERAELDTMLAEGGDGLSGVDNGPRSG